MSTTLAVPKIVQASLLQFLPPEKPQWTIERVSVDVALGTDRWWLVCGDWHYCLQFTGKEVDRLVAWLKHLDLDFSVDETAASPAPRCVRELHRLIQQMIDSPASDGDRGVAV